MPVHQQVILLIEADTAMQTQIARLAREQGWRCLRANTMQEGLTVWDQSEVDIVIVGHKLPDGLGLDCCKQIRQQSSVPLVLLSPSIDPFDQVRSFEAGIDEYIVSPFHEGIFGARLQSLLRRASWQTTPILPQRTQRFGELTIDLHAQRLLRQGQEVHLTRTEWSLLTLLLQHSDKTVSHRMLLQQVWGKAYSEERAYLHAYMRRLRHKLEPDPAQPRYIRSESGLGYRFMTNSPSDHLPTLPVRHTPMYGREQELANACAILRRPDVRLLTLTGPGGAGKTRLSLQIASELAAEFPDGVVFVPLDSLSDARLVVPTIARALGVADGSQDSALRLNQLLQRRHVLLVLDNLEQVLASAPLLGELLTAAPDVKLLITSRSALHLYGAHELTIAPLPLPNLSANLSPEQLAQHPAVALFLDRARSIQPDLVFSPENIAASAAICVRLDGLPLAIELAAAQCRIFTPQALLQRLNQRMNLLIQRAPERPARQQTLQGAFDWSYDLLTAEEQRLFTMLAIFRSRFTLEAAEFICADPRLEPLNTLDVLDGIQGLVNHSLLEVSPATAPTTCFNMLTTVRDYIIQHRMPDELWQTLGERHTNYYVWLAEQAAPEFIGMNQAMWLARIDDEYPNFQGALQWACDNAHGPLAWQLSGALWRYWHARGQINEGRHWFQSILQMPREAISSHHRGRVLNGAGVLALLQDDYPQAQACFESMLMIPGEVDTIAQAHARTDLGVVAYWRGQYEEAVYHLDQGLEQYRQLDDRYGVAYALRYMGMIRINSGGNERAMEWLNQSLRLQRQLGHPSGIGSALCFCGRAHLAQGNLDEAIQYFEESLAVLTPLGNPQGIARAQAYLGRTLLLRKQTTQAATLFSSSLNKFQELGDREGIATALEGLAVLAISQDHAERAAVLFGAASRLRDVIEAPRQPVDQHYLDRFLQEHETTEFWKSAWEIGRDTPLVELLNQMYDLDCSLTQ